MDNMAQLNSHYSKLDGLIYEYLHGIILNLCEK